MIARYDVITSWIAQWDTHFVEPVVFGTTDPYQIAYLLNTFCQQELGAAVADYLFYESSIGAVCGICLENGRRVVVKIYSLAYSARCEHALYPYETTYPVDSSRSLLAQYKA